MKSAERILSRKLRKDGWSVRTIAKKVKCSKSSISKWVRDIPLTQEQIEKLQSNQDKGRAKAANHPNSPKNKWASIRTKIIENARSEIKKGCPKEVLKILGTALYWAEGYNGSRNSVLFSNTDPGMVRVMMRFFKENCKTPKEKFKGKIFIHPHLNIRNAERYWSGISGIPVRQFNKTSIAVSRASKGKKDTLPNGTFNIIINDVICCSKIKGWIEGIRGWGG